MLSAVESSGFSAERETLPRDHAFIETGGDGCGVRTRTHLLGLPRDPDRALGARPHYFYDLRTDPYELRNLAGTEEQTDTAVELERLLRNLDAQIPWTGDKQVQRKHDSTKCPVTGSEKSEKFSYGL
jgi:hypothetical protein